MKLLMVQALFSWYECKSDFAIPYGEAMNDHGVSPGMRAWFTESTGGTSVLVEAACCFQIIQLVDHGHGSMCLEQQLIVL